MKVVMYHNVDILFMDSTSSWGKTIKCVKLESTAIHIHYRVF